MFPQMSQGRQGGKFPGSTKSAPGVNKPRRQNKLDRKAQRAEDFKNQKVKSAKDFNFNQHNPDGTEEGQTHVSGQEVRHLRQNNRNEKGNSAFRDNLAALDAQKESGAVFGKRAQSQYDRMSARADKIDARRADKISARKEARQRAKEAGGSTGQPTNPIDEAVTGGSDNTPSNEQVTIEMPENPTIYNGDGNVVGNENQVGDGNVRGNDNQVGDGNVRGNDNQVGDGNIRSGRDTNIGAGSGSHEVGNNNSGTVGNGNAVVENNINNSQKQEVTQDNDIETNINGNNNTTLVEQDNSVRNYGGDNRSFVYNSSGSEGGLYDSPVSAATMGGFYDVDDSPAAQAKFNDMYTDFNKDNGTRFAGDALATVGMFGNLDARSYTPESMANAIGKSTQYSYDRADRQTGHVFGDMWNDDYITEDWQMPSAPEEIKSNAEEIADKAKDDIDDL